MAERHPGGRSLWHADFYANLDTHIHTNKDANSYGHIHPNTDLHSYAWHRFYLDTPCGWNGDGVCTRW